MKMRALPRSFWQQPNTLADVPPTTYCPPLDSDTEQSSHSEVVGVPNTELLFSLFQAVEDSEVGGVKSKQLPVIRRGRPRKRNSNLCCYNKKDVDPYFTSATIPCRQRQEGEKMAEEQQVFAMISMSEGNNNFAVNDSYLEMLSNLVVNL